MTSNLDVIYFFFFPVIKLSFVQVALNLVQLSENYYVIHGYGGCSRLFEAVLGQRIVKVSQA